MKHICFRTVSFQKVVKPIPAYILLVARFRTVSFQKVVKHVVKPIIDNISFRTVSFQKVVKLLLKVKETEGLNEVRMGCLRILDNLLRTPDQQEKTKNLQEEINILLEDMLK